MEFEVVWWEGGGRSVIFAVELETEWCSSYSSGVLDLEVCGRDFNANVEIARLGSREAVAEHSSKLVGMLFSSHVSPINRSLKQINLQRHRFKHIAQSNEQNRDGEKS